MMPEKMPKKRDLFVELVEGFSALEESAQGKRSLPSHVVQVSDRPQGGKPICCDAGGRGRRKS